VGIKKLKLATEALRIPEGLESLPLPVVVFHATTQEIWSNQAFVETFGKATLDRFQKKSKLGLIHERPVEYALFSMIGRHEGFILENPKGEKVPVEIRVSPLSGAAAGTYLSIFDEVLAKQNLEKQLIQNHVMLQNAFDELKRTQSALTQSAKLASLGELSSGIAHELNQPLQAIMGFSQEIAEFEKLSPSGTEFVQDIISASKKMAEIIAKNAPFTKDVWSRDKAKETFAKMGEGFKVELVDAIPEGQDLKIYSQGTWFDLCRGPHAPGAHSGRAQSASAQPAGPAHVSGATHWPPFWQGSEHTADTVRMRWL
jgi:hypothetical protein